MSEYNTVQYTLTIKCPYSGQCESEGTKCSTCANMPKQKQDHYVPKYYPHPYAPYWYPTGITWGTSETKSL